VRSGLFNGLAIVFSQIVAIAAEAKLGNTSPMRTRKGAPGSIMPQ
jgi:hypothetical protein